MIYRALLAMFFASLVLPDIVRAADPGHLVVATRAIRAKTIIGPTDVALVPGTSPGMAVDLESVIGQEARVTLYSGRPIHPAQLGPPALVDRNEIVVLSFQDGALYIETEARALERGGLGDRIRVMNLVSRMTVRAQVTGPGRAETKP